MKNQQGRQFYLTDVFGVRKYSGNQLATFVDCDGLSNAEMQNIAREINFSESTFVKFDLKNPQRFDVRIFTPAAEVPFAGHPVLGTAWVIREKILCNDRDTLILHLAVGEIEVGFSNDLIWMRQPIASFGDRIEAETIAPLLGLTVDDIDSRFPVTAVSTGFPHWIVPLCNLVALQRVSVERAEVLRFVENSWAKNLLVFAPIFTSTQARAGQTFAVRVFADYYGIAEDSATGSGNGALAAYLSHTQLLGDADVDVIVGQGYEMGRPSQLHLRANGVGPDIQVSVGGQVFGIAQGQWGA